MLERDLNDSGFDKARIVDALDASGADYGLLPPGSIPVPVAQTVAERRARRRPGIRRDAIDLSLVERDGLVFWVLGAPVEASLRRSRRALGFSGRLLARRQTAVLEPNQIVERLEQIDRSTTPYRGLRQWTASGLVPCTAVAPDGRILLLIHGTFSKSDHLVEEMNSTPEGRDLMGKSLAEYSQVLTFDHPTLSVSPVVNAVDLRNALGATEAAIDIVCHSRGGLVARWWMEYLDPKARTRRAVFVGSPLTGTSLAAPDKLRGALKLLSTYGGLLGKAAMATPLLAVPGALLAALASLGRIAAGVPLIDAGVAMIPGLLGQSRTANALELQRLNCESTALPPRYFFVTSDFEPEHAGWDVLKRFRQVGIRTANALADDTVFPGPNDLVVDTEAMIGPWAAAAAGSSILTFAPSDAVHHTIYFRQTRTIDFIAHSLGIGSGVAVASSPRRGRRSPARKAGVTRRGRPAGGAT